MTLLVETSTPAKPVARRRPRRRWTRWIPYAILAIYALAGGIGPLLIDYNPVYTSLPDRLLAPGSHVSSGATAWLGTDGTGRDVLAQVVYGARTSVVIGLATVVVSCVVGVAIGTLAGYFRGWPDMILARGIDILLAFPAILLTIVIAGAFERSVLVVVVALSATAWISFARVTRSQVLGLKSRDFVDATRTLGARTWHLVTRSILPSVTAPILVVATVELGHVILAEASLSFLGLGTPASTPSWGLTIANGRDYLSNAWWISTIPGIFLAILVISFGVLGDALRDRFDPRLRSM